MGRDLYVHTTPIRDKISTIAVAYCWLSGVLK